MLKEALLIIKLCYNNIIYIRVFPKSLSPLLNSSLWETHRDIQRFRETFQRLQRLLKVSERLYRDWQRLKKVSQRLLKVSERLTETGRDKKKSLRDFFESLRDFQRLQRLFRDKNYHKKNCSNLWTNIKNLSFQEEFFNSSLVSITIIIRPQT